VSTDDLELLGAGREAEVFAWKSGHVLRLARNPSDAAMIEREVIALQAAHAAGASVPAVHERLTLDGRPGVVLERVDGVDLLDWLAGRPWAVRSVGRTLGAQHAALHRVEAPAGLPSLRDELRHRSRRRSSPMTCARVPSSASTPFPMATASCTATSIPRTCFGLRTASS
jgi:Ser/Thr protein kinase RdoA (MazF antagonist)